MDQSSDENVSWFLNKDGDNGDVFIFLCQNRARANVTNELLDAVESVDYGSTTDEIKFVCRGSSKGYQYFLSMWDHSIESEFAVSLGSCKSSADFIKALTECSNVRGPDCAMISPAKEDGPSSAKQPRWSLDSLDSSMFYTETDLNISVDNISSKYLGRHTVNLTQLQTPPKEKLVRPVCKPHAEQIKRQLLSDSSLVITALPCIIDTKSISDSSEFDPSNLENYRFFTLGGNHIRTACKSLLETNNLTKDQKRINIDLYGELTTNEARRIANKHNSQSETLPLSFTDKVRQARRLLYEMAKKNDDDEPPASLPENFIPTLQVTLAMENKSVGCLTTIMHVARYSKQCWGLFDKIADSVEQTGTTPVRLSQTQFMNFQGLNEERRRYLLNQVFQGSKSLKQAGAEAKLMKQMDIVRAAFVTCTNSKTWEYAVQRYPDHTSEERLLQFAPLFPASSKKNKKTNENKAEIAIPSEFVRYCNGAQLSTDTDARKIKISVVDKGRDLTEHPDIVEFLRSYLEDITINIPEVIERMRNSECIPRDSDKLDV